MKNLEMLEKEMAVLGELTEEQKALIRQAYEEKMPEKELFEKLGGNIDEKAFEAFLYSLQNLKKEQAVFSQEVSEEEMESVTGGKESRYSYINCSMSGHDGCTGIEFINIYGGKGFPNCKATVEDGSWCGSNDACTQFQVTYSNIEGCVFSDCHRAWK